MAERYHYLNVLKTFGMFAILTLHVFATPYTYWSEFYDSFHKFLAFFLKNILFSWAVPVFVMASGALFLNPEKYIPYSKIFKKYVFRLILVLLSFGYLFALMEKIFEVGTLSASAFIGSFVNVLKGDSWSHLWFVYMITGLYICIPSIKAITCNMEKGAMITFVVIMFIFLSVLPLLSEFTGFKFGIYIPFSGIYILYFILGYLIHSEKIYIKNHLSWIFISINLIYVIVGPFLPNNTIISGAAIKHLSNDSPLSVMMSIGVFALIKNTVKQRENAFDIFFAPISFGVYIIHPLFINFLLKFLKFNPAFYPIYFVNIFVFSITLIGSIFSVVLLRKIPFVRKYIL